MKTAIFLFAMITLLISCNNDPSGKAVSDKRIMLRSDTLNVVKLTDTLVIYESTCRGCAYEASTYFGLSDSTDIIQLQEVITRDNNSADMNGGSISKTIVLFPAKTGKTSFKLYKFWNSNPQPTAKDSTMFTRFDVEVKN